MHGFGEDRYVFVLEKLAFKIDRPVSPGLVNYFHAFIHAAGRFGLGHAEFFVLMSFTTLADAEIQPAVGNNVDHRIRFRDVQWIV